jgi:sulfoxide reductase heme-binding subunit YedZ
MVLLDWLKHRWLQIMVHVGVLATLSWIVWTYSQGGFIIDPIKETTTLTGRAALILLLLSLACTPANTLFGFKQPLRARRALGLYAFLFASLHFLVFVWLDYHLDLQTLLPAMLRQRYVLVGIAAGLILSALALTSTKGWRKRLGKAWKRLHRLVYLAGVLVIVHYLWLAKDPGEPLRYGTVLAVLLVLRIPQVRRAISRLRHSLRSKAAAQQRSDLTA